VIVILRQLSIYFIYIMARTSYIQWRWCPHVPDQHKHPRRNKYQL